MPFDRTSLEELMKQAHLTQRSLAGLINVPHCTIYRWVSGISVPRCENIDKLYKIADDHNLNLEFYVRPSRYRRLLKKE